MDIETRKAMMRSARVPAVMLALYRAVHMSDHAEQGDIPFADRRRYQEAAEWAIENLIAQDAAKAQIEAIPEGW